MKVDNLEMTGKLAAAFYAAFAISHMVSDVLYVFEIIAHPNDLFWQFLPSLLLGFAFVVYFTCLHNAVVEELRLNTKEKDLFNA